MRLAVLTPREREVFDRVVAGKLNKQIAAELGIGLRTVKAYRAQAMEKLGVTRRPSSAGSPANSATRPPEGRPEGFCPNVAALRPRDRACPLVQRRCTLCHFPRDRVRVTIRIDKPGPSVNKSVKQATRRFAMAMGAGGRVLVVEDDDGMREAIETLLDAAGFETAAFASAEALLAGGALDGARCVISDIKLPAMSGLELLTALRAHEGWPPVIMITAHDAPSVRFEAERLRRRGLPGQAIRG